MADPLLLAVETSTPALSLALLRGEDLVAETSSESERRFAEQLLPALDALLVRAAVELAEVDAFAVGIGPGSFTGLRVGLATVKGLAFGSERPVAAVSTLAALAHGAGADAHPIAALLDAQRGELYAAAWDAEANPFLEECVVTPEELAAKLPRACRLVGEGAYAHRSRFEELGSIVSAPLFPRAVDVGVLGARLLARGEGRLAAELAPRYLRRAEAEVRKTGERFENDTA